MPPEDKFNPANIKSLTTADLTDALYGQMQSLIEAGRPDNVMFHYFLPAIPFGPELASFMDLGPAPVPLDNRDEGGEVRFTGNDLMRSAVNFASIVDHVPTVGKVVEKTSGDDDGVVVDLNALVSSGETVSGVYRSVLENCKVVDNSLSDADQERLRKLQAQLYVQPPPGQAGAGGSSSGQGAAGGTTPSPGPGSDAADDTATLESPEDVDLGALFGDGMDKSDFVADASQLPEPTPAMQAYLATQLAYQQVLDTELEKRRSISPDDPNAGEILAASQRRIDAAKSRWETLGQAPKIKSIIAKIDQLSRGGMPSYVKELRDRLDANVLRAAVVATGSGAAPVVEEAYYAALRPNGILRAPTMMKIELDSSHSEGWTSMSSRSTSVKGAFTGFGLWGGSGGKTDDTMQRKFFSEGFRISYEIVQGLIDRPWLKLAFLESDAYTTVDPETKQPLDEVKEITTLSDGARPPSGVLPIIPTTVYFVRDVTVQSNALMSLSETQKKSLSAKGGVSILGFGAGGQHSSKTTTTDTTRLSTHGEMTLKGLFLAAMSSICVGKEGVPSPHPDFVSHPEPASWV